MDQQAFAQLLGNYGEFVGAIAVVITLAYLALQVRSSTRATESKVLVDLSTEIERVVIAVSTDDDLADAMSVALSEGELTDRQQIKLSHWFAALVRVCESHLMQWRLRSTSVDLEAPTKANLRRYARTQFFRRQLLFYMRTGNMTNEFSSWLETEVFGESPGPQS